MVSKVAYTFYLKSYGHFHFKNMKIEDRVHLQKTAQSREGTKASQIVCYFPNIPTKNCDFGSNIWKMLEV